MLIKKHMTSWIKNWFFNFEVLQNPIVIDGIEYWSVENFYAASKSLDVKEKKHIASLSPSAAKKSAKKVKLRPDWGQVKLAIMLKGLVAKFRSGANWHSELMETGGEELIEFSNWGDRYWGIPAATDPNSNKAIPTGELGENWLGRLLTFIRNQQEQALSIAYPLNELNSPKNLAETQQWLIECPKIPPAPKTEKYKGKIIDNCTLPSHRLKVFVFGSREISQLDLEAVSRLDAIMTLGAHIHIGDAVGADAAAQRYIKEEHYSRVTLWYVDNNPKNNAGFKTMRFHGSYKDMDNEIRSRCKYGLSIGNDFRCLANAKRMCTRVVMAS